MKVPTWMKWILCVGVGHRWENELWLWDPVAGEPVRFSREAFDRISTHAGLERLVLSGIRCDRCGYLSWHP